MLHVLCYVSQSSSQARLRADLAHCARLELVAEHQHGDRPHHSRPADAIVADLLDGSGRPLAASLARHQRRSRGIPVIALAQPRPRELRAIGEAARAGADIVMPGHENVAEALHTILRKGTRPREGLLQQLLPLAPTAAARTLLEDCLRAPAGATTSKTLAASFGVTSRTLARRFASAGLPPVGMVVRWLRVLGAIAALRQGVSVTLAARSSGYASVPALRQALRALTGLSVTSARSTDALGIALEAMAAILGSPHRVPLPPERSAASDSQPAAAQHMATTPSSAPSYG